MAAPCGHCITYLPFVVMHESNSLVEIGSPVIKSMENVEWRNWRLS